MTTTHKDDEMLHVQRVKAEPAREDHGARSPSRRQQHVLDHTAGLDAHHHQVVFFVAGFPLTGDKLPLSDVGDEHDITQHCKCLLSHKDPTHPACVVVLFPYATPDMWYCRVVGDDHRRWKHYSYDIGNYALPAAYRPPTKKIIPGVAAVRGKLFFTRSPKHMCAVDFAITKHGSPLFRHDKVRQVEFPPGISACRDWLVESQDRLFLVDICFVSFHADNIADIRVYKLNFRATVWRRVRDIGDAVFLPAKGSSPIRFTS
ncbi:hypothetical protein EJB05_30046, partial [Eragrostis curvula]